MEKSLKAQGFKSSPLPSSNYDLFLEVPDTESKYSFGKSIRIFPNWDEKLIQWPALKAAMFLMASWGLIDLIYEEPDLSIISETADSPYDGIKAVKLNDLGAYVLGLTQTYESQIKAPFTLELAEDFTDGVCDAR